MTRSIEEALNLPPIKEALAKKESEQQPEVSEESGDAEVDKMAHALSNVGPNSIIDDSMGEKEHAKEMDEVMNLALEAHKSILDFGFNVEAKHAGSIMAQAANHLDIALRASKSKSDYRAKIMSLKMERLQYDIEHDLNSTDAEIISDNSSKGEICSRNDLILQMKEEAKKFAVEQQQNLQEDLEKKTRDKNSNETQ